MKTLDHSYMLISMCMHAFKRKKDRNTIKGRKNNFKTQEKEDKQIGNELMNNEFKSLAL